MEQEKIGWTPEPQYPQPYSPITTLLLLLLLILLFVLAGSLLMQGLALWQGVDLQTALNGLDEKSSLQLRQFVREILAINQVFTFLLPGAVLVWYIYRSEWKSYLRIDQAPTLSQLGFGVLFMLFSTPLAQAAYWLNKQIPLPAWMHSIENSTADMLNGILKAEHPYEVVINIVLVGLIPALGEELVFRGIVQQQFSRWMGRSITAVWVTAFVFSFIHFQFEGFLARVILGAVLGYLLYWTNNLWVPVFAHFVNNGSQVLLQYLYKESFIQTDPDKMEQLPWTVVLVSFALLLLTAAYFIRSKENTAKE